MINNYKIGECGERPWGSWRVDNVGRGFAEKTIKVNVNGCLSLQSHKYRSEKWMIVSGDAEVTVNDDKSVLHSGDVVEIPVESIHRLKNIGDDVLVVKEIQLGEILDENDIIRYEDLYGRVQNKK
ncbi:MAG: cupin domain-containing protein [Alphaproteobacteria bacterium]|nr:cupin domain-containing protein [Alphaproteobacteria bacterium]